jgi:hypothetical protein
MSSAVVKKEALFKTGCFDQTLTQGEDLDLWIRLAATGYRFDYIDKALVRYRLKDEEFTNLQVDTRFLNNTTMLKKLFSNKDFKNSITINMRRIAWSSLWGKYAYNLSERGDRKTAITYSLRSLLFKPTNLLPLKTLIKCLITSPKITERKN